MVVDGRDRPADRGRLPTGPEPQVSVVTVAHGAEPWLERSVGASLASRGVSVEVVLVDNGCTDGAVDRLAGREGVRVVRPGRNLGFAAGCNAGAAVARGTVLALVNPDAVVEPDALARLAAIALESGVGIATCSLRLAEDPELLNSAGNELHFLGLSWSGAYRAPAATRPRREPVAAASGAGMAIRRALWNGLDGFVPEFFAYQEDAELSLRVWQRGLSVEYVPDAVVVHRYEFSRNPRKFYLLDRNRLLLVLTLYEARTLALLAPLLLLQEAAMFAVALAQGWFPERLRSVGWVLRHAGWVRRRRRAVAAGRVLGDGDLAGLFATVVQPGNHPVPPWAVTAQAPLRLAWAVLRRLLRRSARAAAGIRTGAGSPAGPGVW
jgi:GT2 family glycosyltransferase